MTDKCRKSTEGEAFPALREMTNFELVMLMGQCGKSDDPSDKAFAKACRDELASRKPEQKNGRL
jgi:hypothetical protein